MLSTAFVHLSSVVVEEVVVDDAALAFTARAVTREAACPDCGTVSARVHGGYGGVWPTWQWPVGGS